MSLGTWKKKFYPIPANQVKEKDAIDASLLKWVGMRESNLKKHGLRISFGGSIEDSNGEYLDINDATCSLCVHYLDEGDCRKCPLFQHLGHRCDHPIRTSVFITGLNGDPEPMIAALWAAKKKAGRKK